MHLGKLGTLLLAHLGIVGLMLLRECLFLELEVSDQLAAHRTARPVIGDARTVVGRELAGDVPMEDLYPWATHAAECNLSGPRTPPRGQGPSSARSRHRPSGSGSRAV